MKMGTLHVNRKERTQSVCNTARGRKALASLLPTVLYSVNEIQSKGRRNCKSKSWILFSRLADGSGMRTASF